MTGPWAFAPKGYGCGAFEADHQESPPPLKPDRCPFCDGSSNVWKETFRWFIHSYFVKCTNLLCGGRSGIFATKGEAIMAWNKRSKANDQ